MAARVLRFDDKWCNSQRRDAASPVTSAQQLTELSIERLGGATFYARTMAKRTRNEAGGDSRECKRRDSTCPIENSSRFGLRAGAGRCGSCAGGWHGRHAGFSGTLSGDYATSHVPGGGSSGHVWGGNAEGIDARSASTGASAAGRWRLSSANFSGGGGNARSLERRRQPLRAGQQWRPHWRNLSAMNCCDAQRHQRPHHAITACSANGGQATMLTVGGKVGGFDGNVFRQRLLWQRSWCTYYCMPDLALSAAIDYAHVNSGGDRRPTYTLRREYLVSETMPISVGGGWHLHERRAACMPIRGSSALNLLQWRQRRSDAG